MLAMSQKTALQRAVDLMGGPSKSAEILGVSVTAIHAFLKTDGPQARPLPLERCLQVERATNGLVRCEDLRPDIDWSRPAAEAGAQDRGVEAVVDRKAA